jgi:hypothetical protein
MRDAKMTLKALKLVRPDAKGRIPLGPSLTQGVSSYSVTIEDNHRIILEPNVEIPAREKWLFDNKLALIQVQKGLEDSAAERIKSKGSFAKFIDEDIE